LSTPILHISNIWKVACVFFFLFCAGKLGYAQQSDAYQFIAKSQNHYSKEPDSALYYARIAREIADKGTDSTVLLKAYNTLAMSQKLVGLNTQALATSLYSKKFVNGSELTEDVANRSLINGHIYRQLGENKMALDQYENAINLFEESNDSSGMSYAYTGMGIVYFDQGDFVKALNFHLKSDSLWSSDEKDLHADLYNNIGAVCVEIEKHAEAMWYYQKAMTIYQEINWESSISMMHYNIGELYMIQGDYNQSKVECFKSLKIGHDIGSAEEIKWAYYGLYELEKALGSESQALTYHEHYHRLSDSLLESSSLQEVLELARVYEQEKVEKENFKLEADKVSLILENDQKNRVQNALWVGLIALMVIVIGGILVILRIKKVNNTLIVQRQDILVKNEQIDETLKEKELLLKEIHHRVKNNLQIISSLLNLQKHKLTPESYEAFEESQNRIQAIALIHKKLYQSESIAYVNFTDYLKELIEHQQSLYNTDVDSIEFDIQTNNIELNLDTSVPLGLIVAELMANAFKHAFVGVDEKKVSVEIVQVGEKFKMTFTDNGRGLPDSFNDTEQSLGMDIIHALADQLEGNIEFSSEPNQGTSCLVNFSEVKE